MLPRHVTPQCLTVLKLVSTLFANKDSFTAVIALGHFRLWSRVTFSQDLVSQIRFYKNGLRA